MIIRDRSCAYLGGIDRTAAAWYSVRACAFAVACFLAMVTRVLLRTTTSQGCGCVMISNDMHIHR